MLPYTTITGKTRSSGRRLAQPDANTAGLKALSAWGPRLLNKVLAGDAFTDCEPDPPRPPRGPAIENKAEFSPPSDADIVERKGYYAFLLAEYNDQFPSAECSDDAGRVIVWTDGSRQTIQDQAQAGAGVFYGYGNPANRKLAVSGTQTNQRAEAVAFLHVLRTETRPFCVMTDSMYVHMGIEGWRFDWRAKAWFKSPMKAIEMDNADLWKEIDRRIENRDQGSVLTKWCKAHALRRHVHAGLTSDLNVWGNNHADALAGAAAREAKLKPTMCESAPHPKVDLSDQAMIRAHALSAAITAASGTDKSEQVTPAAMPLPSLSPSAAQGGSQGCYPQHRTHSSSTAGHCKSQLVSGLPAPRSPLKTDNHCMHPAAGAHGERWCRACSRDRRGIAPRRRESRRSIDETRVSNCCESRCNLACGCCPSLKKGDKVGWCDDVRRADEGRPPPPPPAVVTGALSGIELKRSQFENWLCNRFEN
eukprot:gene57525-biopygen70186